jgi:ABC-type lipopolysaccharide export system ATPase subunit
LFKKAGRGRQSERLQIHRGYVFKIGSIFMEDTVSNLLKSEEVKKAFLGG